MTKQAIGGISAQNLPFSKAIRAGDFVFVSGQVAFDEAGRLVEDGIEAQTDHVMRNVEAILKEAGCGLDDVVKTTVWLADARDFGRFNATNAKYFPENPPARSTVEAPLMIDAKVEVEVVAYKPL
jgi:reactive intermediate/imine deaminase